MCRRPTRSPRWRRPRAGRSPRAMWAAARVWSATDSKAASARVPARRALTRSGFWCSATADGARSFASRACRWGRRSRGSIIIVVATDAPLLPHQMKRLARRASLGVARTGSSSGNGSGDIFIAFSTANADAGHTSGLVNLTMAPNDEMNKLFEATVEATEEAIVNAMVGAETMTGFEGHTVIALPHDRLQEVLKKYDRLAP